MLHAWWYSTEDLILLYSLLRLEPSTLPHELVVHTPGKPLLGFKLDLRVVFKLDLSLQLSFNFILNFTASPGVLLILL